MGTALILGTVLSVGSTAYQIDQQKAAKRDVERANNEQKKARRIEQRIQEMRVNREKRRQVQEAMRQKALLDVVSAGRNTKGSSLDSNAGSSIQSQLSNNLGFINQTQNLTNQQSIFMQNAADFESDAAGHGANVQIGGQVGRAGSFMASNPSIFGG